MTSWGQLVGLSCSLVVLFLAMFFDFLFSCWWPKWKRSKKRRKLVKPTKDQQYPWRIDLQQASLTEYSKILEARRLELLTMLNTDDFNDELMAEWISLMEQRDRILRLTIAEVNQAEMVRRFVRLFEAMKDTLSLPDLSSAPISLHSSLIHSWQEVRRYLTKQQVDVDHINTVNNVGLAQLRSTKDPVDPYDDGMPNAQDFNSTLSAPMKFSSPLKGSNLPPLKTSDICKSLDDLLSPQQHCCYTPTIDDNMSVCTTDTFDDRIQDRRRLKMAHRRFFPTSFSCQTDDRVVESAQILQEKCRQIAASSELD